MSELFSRKLTEAGDRILGMKDNALIVHHNDADGIAAAAIIIKARQAMGLKTRTLVARYNAPLPSLLKEKAVIFVDFGAALAKEIDGLKKASVVVLDHHSLSADKPRPVPRENLLFINPGDFKLDAEHAIDGGQQVCGASMAFHALKHSNVEGLATLALVGAAGDMQLKKGALEFNRAVVEHGVSSGEILKAGRSLNAFDSHSPLFEVVANFLSPALKDLIHNEEASKEFLSKNGFDPQKKFAEMTPAEQENLTNVLEKHAWQNNLSAKAIAKMRAEKFSFPKHASLPHAFRDPVTLAGLFNACIHLPFANEKELQRNAKKAIKIALGNTRLAKPLIRNEVELTRQRREYIRLGLKLGGVDRNMFVIRGGTQLQRKNHGLGIASSALADSGLVYERPIIAIGVEDGKVVVEARASEELVESGLNLQKIMSSVATKMGGGVTGGGHKAAAGADGFTEGRLLEFLRLVNEEIAQQLFNPAS